MNFRDPQAVWHEITVSRESRHGTTAYPSEAVVLCPVCLRPKMTRCGNHAPRCWSNFCRCNGLQPSGFKLPGRQRKCHRSGVEALIPAFKKLHGFG
jgi:hypothetical protein